jgi:hypothetical protein
MDTDGSDQVRASTTAARYAAVTATWVRGLTEQVRVSPRGFEICVPVVMLATTSALRPLAEEGT